MLKNAQISIFIIVSAIIVLVSGFLFFSGNLSLFSPPEAQLMGEFQEHVQTCIADSTDTGVFLLGFQGGYIEIGEEIQINPERRLTFGSQGSFENSTFTLPNWDSELGEVPTREFMQEELATYIEEDAISCIQNRFSSYENYLTIETEYDRFDVETVINDLSVEVYADLPVSVVDVSEEIEFDISSYYIDFETPLGDMHDLAIDIFTVQIQTLLFEQLVLDQIYSAPSDSSAEVSMPTEGMIFSCSPHIWTKTELKETLAELNNNNFRYLQFDGTRPIEHRFQANLVGEFSDLEQYFRTNYFHYLPGEPKPTYENYEVNVMMPSSEITGSEGYFNELPYREFDVTPSQGEIVRAMDLEIGNSLGIPIPCMQIFHHLYTIDYDLMIRLNDFTHDEQGFLFQFPLRVEIEENTPKQSPQTSFTPESSTANNELFCDPENRNTNAEIYVQDIMTGEYLNGAEVEYRCAGLRCDVGSTSRAVFETGTGDDIERQDSIPKIETELGFCDGGELRVELDGYHMIEQEPERIETGNFMDIGQITARMVQTKDFHVDINSFYAIDPQTCQTRPQDRGKFYITVSSEEYDIDSTVYHPIEMEGVMDTITLLRMSDIRYDISVIYIDDETDEIHGLMELESKSLDYSRGNNFEVMIPISSEPLDSDNFANYFENQDQLLNNQHACPGVNFGVQIR